MGGAERHSAGQINVWVPTNDTNHQAGQAPGVHAGSLSFESLSTMISGTLPMPDYIGQGLRFYLRNHHTTNVWISVASLDETASSADEDIFDHEVLMEMHVV